MKTVGLAFFVLGMVGVASILNGWVRLFDAEYDPIEGRIAGASIASLMGGVVWAYRLGHLDKQPLLKVSPQGIANQEYPTISEWRYVVALLSHGGIVLLFVEDPAIDYGYGVSFRPRQFEDWNAAAKAIRWYQEKLEIPGTLGKWAPKAPDS